MAIPVSLEDARRQLRLEATDDSRDEDLRGYIADAAAWVETCTGHILVARNVTMAFPGNKPAIISAWPLGRNAVPTITYVGADAQPVVIDGKLVAYSRPARVKPLPGTSWPFSSSEDNFVVTVRAGYEAEDEVPGNIRRAMLVLITAYDQDREGGAIFQAAERTARLLCDPFRVIGL